MIEHESIEREWRNGWLYIHCSCGAWIGPFFSEDVAADCFDLHAAGRNDLIDGIASPALRASREGD